MRRRLRERAESLVDELLAELVEEGVDLERLRLGWYPSGWRASLDGEQRAVRRSPEEALRLLLNELQVHGGDPRQHELRRWPSWHPSTASTR